MITLDKVSKAFGSRILFEDVTETFSDGNRYGLTGPNGSGKSTLMKIIMRKEEPTTGTITLPDRIGILKQNIEDFQNERVIDCAIMGNNRLWKAMQERDALYEQEMTDEIGMRLGELEGIIAEENGYMAEADAEQLLAGMGIDANYFNQKMGAIPTDIQYRVLLCQALFGEPQALLLDEPTNHLDLESISWLESFLKNYRGTLIVTSHDRHFLNAVTTHIADIDYETIITYPGNYDQMLLTKDALREQKEQEARSKEKKITQLRQFVARFGAGTRASQVQSRLREIDRLKPEELKKTNIQRPYIRFSPSEQQPGKVVLTVRKLSKSYDTNHVINTFSLEIGRGDKIGVIGNNGRGKTTLLKMLAGDLIPDAGTLSRGHNVLINSFPQNHTELVERSDATLFSWLKERHPTAYDQDIRSALGKMLFGGDDAFKTTLELSGGETARLILAHIMLSDHNFLILDEPNNHLDLEAVSALTWALCDYPEAVVVASHDRNLIANVATKIIAFEADGIHLFDGPLEEYLAKRAQSV